MIVAKKKVIFLLLAGIVVNAVPRWFHWVVCGKKVYYMGDALSFVLIIIAGMIDVKKEGVVRVVYDYALILALANLGDELFLNPVSFGINEMLFAIVVTIWTTYRIIKCSNQTHPDR